MTASNQQKSTATPGETSTAEHPEKLEDDENDDDNLSLSFGSSAAEQFELPPSIVNHKADEESETQFAPQDIAKSQTNDMSLIKPEPSHSDSFASLLAVTVAPNSPIKLSASSISSDQKQDRQRSEEHDKIQSPSVMHSNDEQNTISYSVGMDIAENKTTAEAALDTTPNLDTETTETFERIIPFEYLPDSDSEDAETAARIYLASPSMMQETELAEEIPESPEGVQQLAHSPNSMASEVLEDSSQMETTAEHNQLTAGLNDVEQTINAAKAIENLRKDRERLIEEANKAARLSSEISAEMIAEVQQLLRLFGYPYITSVAEAEAQCAYLEQAKLTDGTITDDSDIFLFGGKIVYRHFSSKQKSIQLYNAHDLQKTLCL